MFFLLPYLLQLSPGVFDLLPELTIGPSHILQPEKYFADALLEFFNLVRMHFFQGFFISFFHLCGIYKLGEIRGLVAGC